MSIKKFCCLCSFITLTACNGPPLDEVSKSKLEYCVSELKRNAIDEDARIKKMTDKGVAAPLEVEYVGKLRSALVAEENYLKNVIESGGNPPISSGRQK